VTHATPVTGKRAFPERVARYELLLPIGTGGSATVYLARAPLLRADERAVPADGLFREVAVKLMHPKLDAGEGQYAGELMDEARIVAAIRHPNVVSILEVGDAPEGVYLVMDYVQGDTLSGLIRALLAAKRQLPLDIAGRVLADALLGLHTAHELKDAGGKPLELVHRDFSPQNLLVGVDGVTRLTDFGIAKVTGRMAGTASGVVKGKVGYMSPEQALGEKLDRRSDIWAAGVVAWELLAQRRLFEGEDASVLLSIVSTDPPDVRSVREDCPPACAAVIARALSRDRAQRYETALELRDALLEALRQSGGVAEIDAVGTLVTEVVAPQLEQRKLRAREIGVLRSSLRAASGSAVASEPGAAPARRWPLAGALLVALLGLWALWMLQGSPEPRARGEAAGAGVSVSAFPSPAPSVPGAATASADAVLRFFSAEPISGLVVAGKSIYVPSPATSIEVQVPAGVSFPITVQARTLDGRSQRAQLAAGQQELELAFAAPEPGPAGPLKRPEPSRKPTPPKRAIRAIPGSELAPPPYE
jgi:eukaryotic-like serine/threonine-protein kinase